MVISHLVQRVTPCTVLYYDLRFLMRILIVVHRMHFASNLAYKNRAGQSPNKPGLQQLNFISLLSNPSSIQPTLTSNRQHEGYYYTLRHCDAGR